MTLEVIIVSFNTAALLKECLKSLFDNLKKEKLQHLTQVTVVDNASKDDSVAMVRKNFPQVKIIANKKNLGFAKANNQAIIKGKSEFIFLLNSDTLITNNCLTQLLNQIKKDDHVVAMGPKLINKDGSLQPSFGFIPTLDKVFYWMLFIDDLPLLSSILKPYHAHKKALYQKRLAVDWISGAALLLRRSCLSAVGLLDESIFMYGEDVDWCYRARQAGFQIIYTPLAQVIHFKGQSSVGKDSGIVEEYSSLIYFYKKHFPKQILLLRPLLKFGALLRIFLFGIIGKHQSKVKLYAKAYAVA